MDRTVIAPGAVIGRWTLLDSHEKTANGDENGSVAACAVQNVMFWNEV